MICPVCGAVMGLWSYQELVGGELWRVSYYGCPDRIVGTLWWWVGRS